MRDALDSCRPDRLDHGVALADDPALVSRVLDEGIALTMCPLSNRALNVVPDLARHPLKTFLDAGLVVCVNSDDPPFFGGYVNGNYEAAADALGLSAGDVYKLARHSVRASFMAERDKAELVGRIEAMQQG